MSPSAYDLCLWEISRRALRSEKLMFSFDKKTKINIQKLSNIISDSAPSIIIEMNKDGDGKNNHIEIFNLEKIIGIIGLEEPKNIDCLWIPTEINSFWEDFERKISYLVDAGYPGCIGCGGPGSEEEWDENKYRIQFREMK